MNKLSLRREIRPGTLTLYTRADFTPLPDGGVLFEVFSTNHEGKGSVSVGGARAMTAEQAEALLKSLLAEREVIGRTKWTEVKE